SVPTANSDTAELKPQAPPPKSLAEGGAAEAELVNPPATDHELAIFRSAPEVVPQPDTADPVSLAKAPAASEVLIHPHPASFRSRLVNAPLWRNPTVVAACLIAVGVVIGISVYRSKSHGPRVPIFQSEPALTQPDPIAVRQQTAIDAADKLVAGDDLAGAQHVLQAVAGLKGPLDATIQERLAGISASMKDEGIRRLRRNEEQSWQDAVKQVDNGNFDLAKSNLRKILNLGDGGQRKADAQRYLNQVVPAREKEEHLFGLAQRASEGTDSGDLQRANDLLNQVIALNGRRKSDAETLRDTVNSKMETLKQQRQNQIGILNAEIDTRLRSGDFAGARQQLDKIKQLGGDVTSTSGKIDEEQKKRQAQLAADAVFQKAVQRYQHALGSNNRSELESARADLENIAKAGGSHATEAANDANQLTQQLAQLDTRPVSPPVQPKVSLPPAVDFQEVRSEVHSVLQRYIDAFEHRDADALQQVWPKMGDRYSKFKTSFATA